MAWLQIEFAPASGFATPVRGTTLFGQCCALLGREAPERLATLLEGYTRGRPFVVIGDPRPLDHVPRPTVPMSVFEPVAGLSAKEAKARRWVPKRCWQEPVEKWLAHSLSDGEVGAPHGVAGAWRAQRVHAMAATSAGHFVRWQDELWHAPALPLVLDVVLDEARCSTDEILDVLRAIGWQGYGAGASRGLGKFELGAARPHEWTPPAERQALLTLGHCTPLQVDWEELVHSFYRTTIHHGRHGPEAAADTGHASFVKAPVVLAQPGALLCPRPGHALPWYGAGLGGRGQLSLRDPRTVLQGYAPVLPVHFETYRSYAPREQAV